MFRLIQFFLCEALAELSHVNVLSLSIINSEQTKRQRFEVQSRMFYVLIKHVQKMEEPVRKSVLHYLREVKKFNLCRLIFCAKITEDCNDVAQLFDTVIKEKYSQLVTGLLLVHTDFIIHLIESSEDEVFQLCNVVFTTNREALTNMKCLYVQNETKKRFFQKWYSRKVNDCDLTEEEVESFEDNFESVSAMYKTIIIKLHKLYSELWDISVSKSYEDFIKRLDLICKKCHPNIPCKASIKFILRSRWGYDLATLAKNYCNLRYPSDFYDCSSVPEIIREIDFDVDECKFNSAETSGV